MTDENGYPVGATRTSFRIIEALETMEGAGVTELAEHLSLSKSAVHNHLTTLRRLGYVSQSGTTYHLGLRFFDIGLSARARHRLYRIAKPTIDTLGTTTGETANLLIEENGQGVYLYRTKNDPVEDRMTRVPLHATAAGKAILAHLPDDAVQRIADERGLPRRTSNTITDYDSLRAELQTVRDRGIAFDREERVDDRQSVGAPIDVDDDVLGAISVSGPSSSMSGKRLEEDITGLVVSAATEIEVSIASD